MEIPYLSPKKRRQPQNGGNAQVPIKNGSNGFELLDKNKFGATEEEMKINYQRALQGEIERTIKVFQKLKM